VGCGDKPKGDVNVDKRRGSKADIIADAYHLPFRSATFDVVYTSHILEHLCNPIMALREWKRVSRREVRIRIPSHYLDDRSLDHIYSWNKHTLKRLCSLVFTRVESNYTRRLFDVVGKKSIVVNCLSRIGGFFTEIEAVCQK